MNNFSDGMREESFLEFVKMEIRMKIKGEKIFIVRKLMNFIQPFRNVQRKLSAHEFI